MKNEMLKAAQNQYWTECGLNPVAGYWKPTEYGCDLRSYSN